jgi:hypothetical protein
MNSPDAARLAAKSDAIPSAAAELAALFPAPRTVEIAGRSIQLTACGIGQAGRIIDAGAGLYQKTLDGESFEELFERYPDDTAALIVAATSLDAEWVQGLSADDKYELASHWLAMNADFFVRRRLPTLARIRGALLSIGGGQISSNIYTDMDTPMRQPTPSAPHPSTFQPSPAPNGAASASSP